MCETIELQNEILRLIKWFKNFCEKNGIFYFMMGGTLLGAVRHKGFIPWDDDADFGVRYQDYVKLISLITKEELDGQDIEISLLNNNSKFCMPFLKICSKKIMIIEQGKEQIWQNLFIDIFPISYCGNSMDEALNNRAKYRFYYSLSNRKNFNIECDNKIHNIILNFLSKINSRKSLAKKIDKFYRTMNKNKTSFSCDFDGNTKGIVNSNVFDEVVFLSFEDINLPASKEYDYYLTHIFGNYMELPSIDERHTHLIESKFIK